MLFTLVLPAALRPDGMPPAASGRDFALDRLVSRLEVSREWVAGPRSEGIAHRAWLARECGLPHDPPATGPYLWRAAGGHLPPGAWVAQCDPARLRPTGKGFLLTPAPARDAAEEEARFRAAGEAAAERGFSIERRDGRWFLLSPSPLRIECAPLEAALGRALPARLPLGPDARSWRILADDIGMRWHALGEAPDALDGADGLWLHGGGTWQPPAARLAREVCGAEPFLRALQEAAGSAPCAREYLELAGAGDAPDASPDAPDRLAARIEDFLARARSRGAREVEIVACGSRRVRVLRRRPLLRAFFARRADSARTLAEAPSP